MSGNADDSQTPARPSLEGLPVVGRLLAFGPDDPVFDGLILAGPLLIAVLAIGGRNAITTALASAYVLAFAGYVGWRARPG